MKTFAGINFDIVLPSVCETKFHCSETCQTKYIVIYSGLGLTRASHPYQTNFWDEELKPFIWMTWLPMGKIKLSPCKVLDYKYIYTHKYKYICMFNNKYRACKCLRPRRKGQLIAPIFLPVFNSSVFNYTQFGLLIQGRNTTTSTIDGKWWMYTYQFSFSYQYTKRKVKIECRGGKLAIRCTGQVS